MYVYYNYSYYNVYTNTILYQRSGENKKKTQATGKDRAIVGL